MPTFISKASEDTAEGGRAQEQLPHIAPVSQWGTKPSLVPSALPAHTLRQNPKQGAQTGQTGRSAVPGTSPGGMAFPCSTLPHGGGTQPYASRGAEGSTAQRSTAVAAVPPLHSLQNKHPPPTHPLQSPVTRWPSRALSRRIKAVHEGKNVYF